MAPLRRRLQAAMMPLLLLVTGAAAASVRPARPAHARKHLGTQLSSLSAPELARELAQRRLQSKVWMAPQEIALIESFLEPGDVMLEWGSGRSTLYYSQFVREYYSIEHDQQWYDQMKAELGAGGKVHYLASPVAKGHKGWGGGFDEGTYEQFKEYVHRVDDFQVKHFNKVLIDGRARAFCAEYILRFLTSESIVFIHDYNPRGQYHAAADAWYTKVAEVYEGQSLVVLRPKPDALAQAKAGATLRTDFGAAAAGDRTD